MSTISAVYDVPETPALQCRVTGRLALAQVTVEIHQYRFNGPQDGVFRSPRAFLDLALSPRPGMPRGAYPAMVRQGLQPLGDIIFIPAGQGLETKWGAGEQTSICCGFEEGRVDLDDATFTASELEACLDVRSAYVREALVRLAREIEAPGFCSDLLAEAIWTELVIELSRYLQRSRGAADQHHGRLTAAQLRRIEELIEQPGKLPSIAALAQLCDLSTRHFFRMFRAATGETLAAYAAARRIDRAKQLLTAPRPAVKEVAWRCGFETSAAFSAAFRKSVGVTPKQFRQSMLH
jgi:AraC family transcriptional regulator